MENRKKIQELREIELLEVIDNNSQQKRIKKTEEDS